MTAAPILLLLRTACEPDLPLRLESHKANRKQAAVPAAHVENDRTGVLAGQSIPWPTFDDIAKPLLGLLGPTQASPPTDDEAGVKDAEGWRGRRWSRGGGRRR
ncbi:MAG TPA: hypothetical protein VMS17_14975 [Gemmataceae bacterium]|nr:hypothetical protein [Gemmataceae bacterium]